MADIESKEVSWLWPNRIAAGRLTLLVGVPGAGKSFLTCDMASRVSLGRPWPDGSGCDRGSVLLITAEDDPHDTIRPRLDAHGADVDRIALLTGKHRSDDEVMFTLDDVQVLESALKGMNDCSLVIIDPIGSFLGGGTDSHKDNEVRQRLAPIANLAERYGPAILMVAHRRKSPSTTADATVLGSRAFTGIARSVWHLFRDMHNKERRLLLSGKNNLAREQGGLAFSIAGKPSVLQWESGTVNMTADDANALEQVPSKKGAELRDAKEWLRTTLAGGPKSVNETRKRAESDGISKRMLDRARAEMGVRSSPDGFGGSRVWQLPGE